MSDIYEQKPWLNDDPQTVDTLKKNLGIDGSSSIPSIGSGDNGKVLTANVSGDTKTASWETPSDGLPEIGSGDGGKVLTANVSGDTKTATWETPSDELPAIGAGDDGKVLTANVSGDTKTVTWETPSGGGSSAFIVNVDWTYSDWTLDKNFNEIYAAFLNGDNLRFQNLDGNYSIFVLTSIASYLDDPDNPMCAVTLCSLYANTVEEYTFMSTTGKGVLTYTPDPNS